MNIQTTYKTTRDFETTTRPTNIRLHRISTHVGEPLEFLQSYNQLMVYKDSNGKYYRTDKNTAAPRWSVTTASHVNKYLQGVTAEVVDQGFIDQAYYQACQTT
jgi:hypothetical protein